MAATTVATPHERQLRNLVVVTGLSCIAIGIYHAALGTASVPGATDANATVDSRERFYSVYFAGYGIAWLRALRTNPIRTADVHLLAGVMLVSGIARLLSLIRVGRPHWLQELLTAVEVLLPAWFVALTRPQKAVPTRA